MSTSSRNQTSQGGQSLLEYALLVFRIAVVAIFRHRVSGAGLLEGLSGALPAL